MRTRDWSCRGITLQQPLAWAILTAGARVISRAKGTDYRGPIAIHAGKLVDELRATTWPPMVEAIRAWRAEHPGVQLEMPAGAVVAVARLVDVHFDDGCCRPWGDVLEAHWCITDVTPLRSPHPLVGNRGLWPMDSDLAAALSAGLPPERTP